MSKTRLVELDVFRGIAAIAVVLYHYTFRYEEIYGHQNTNYSLNFSIGYLGVQLFFIISGFVIFMTLERCVNIKDFVFKRATRLYPAYLSAVILTFSIVSIFGLEGREVGILDALFNLTMLQGFFTPFGVVSNVDGVYWSLNTEIIFYIVMGIIFTLGLLKRIEIILIAWLTVSFTFKVLNNYFDSFIIHGVIYYCILNYCNLFIAGILFYKLKTENKFRYHFLIVFCMVHEMLFNEMIHGIIVILFFILFYLLIYGKLSFLNLRPLAFLGTISYSLYLVHQNIGYIIINFLEENGLNHEIYILVPIFISIVIAWGFTVFIEKPFQNYLRNKNKVFFTRKQKSITFFSNK